MKNEKLEDFLGLNNILEIKIPECEVLKRMRTLKKICQEEASLKIEVSRRTLRRFESGKQHFSTERRRKLLLSYGFTVNELNQYIMGKNSIPNLPPHFVRQKSPSDPKRSRKYQNVIEKPHRILKILRHQAQLSQTAAAKRCGFKRNYIDNIESGRVDLTREKISHVVKSLGFTLHDFDTMMSQKIIRDEILIECTKLLKKIDDEKLTAVKALLENFA